jgi:hypothetical protein
MMASRSLEFEHQPLFCSGAPSTKSELSALRATPPIFMPPSFHLSLVSFFVLVIAVSNAFILLGSGYELFSQCRKVYSKRGKTSLTLLFRMD